MSPTHTNKSGACYRYYISQLSELHTRCRAQALVLAALRKHLNTSGADQQLPTNDRDLVERHLERLPRVSLT
jgi:hypothetical protein